MTFLDIIMTPFKLLLMKLFPGMTPIGTIRTQISMYKRFKKKYPDVAENDILNSLITSRINAPFRDVPKEIEVEYYTPLIGSPKKTLEDVITIMVFYEWFDNPPRRASLSAKNIPVEVIENERKRCETLIKKELQKLKLES